MKVLTEEFLGELISRLDDENTVGIALVGSFARQEEGPFSDVDLWKFVRQMPSSDADMLRLEWIESHLISIKILAIDKEKRDFSIPERAIWAVPGWQQSKILLDKDGTLTSLREAAVNFRWDSLKTAADRYASHHLGGSAEEIYKILDGLLTRNECKTLYAIWSLSQDLAHVLVVQRGVLIPTENAFIDCAQATAGRDSEWTRQFRRTIGLDRLQDGQSPYISYAIAGLRLYRETAALMKEIIQTEDAPLVGQALEVIREAGY